MYSSDLPLLSSDGELWRFHEKVISIANPNLQALYRDLLDLTMNIRQILILYFLISKVYD